LQCELPVDILDPICRYMELNTLVCFGTSCNTAHRLAMSIADESISVAYQGVDVLMSYTPVDLQAMPRWVRLLSALKPGSMVKGHHVAWSNLTMPLPLILESKGPWFAQFTIVAAKAPNGTPTIGLMDADASLGEMGTGECSKHLASSDCSERSFEISFSPGKTTAYAVLLQGNSQELMGGEITTCKAPIGTKHRAYTAYLNWPTLGDEMQSWNTKIQAGLFVENGCVSFFRNTEEGWHSSGVICRALPPRISPCMFLSSFKGYAHVRFAGLCRKPPRCCPMCDATGHGTLDGWNPWTLRRREIQIYGGC